MAAEEKISDLCPACQKRAKEEEDSKKTRESGTKEDKFEKIRAALARAEKCKYFYHHGLFDKDGKPDPQAGQRTCSLVVKARCGHEESKHGSCTDWRDGKDCPDWQEKG